MSDTKQTKKASKLGRTQVVTIRLDPKLRYLVELAARKQRRTTSSFIEWAVAEMLRRNIFLDENTRTTLEDEAPDLWSVHEADRLVRLAMQHPELLTFEEEQIWSAIKETGVIDTLIAFATRFRPPHPFTYWDNLESSVFPFIRKHWETFRKVASGELTRDQLPHWEPPKGLIPPQEDGDIPF